MTAIGLGRFAGRPWVWWATLVPVCAVLLAPLALVDVPPLLDYPNHLARAFLLAFGQQDRFLSAIAEPHWAIIPNLAIDLVLPRMVGIWPVHVAGRMLLGVILVLPVLGCAALGRAVLGRRTYWSLASGLVACNELFLLGFMNFQLSVGLALLFAAAWVRLRERHPAANVATGVLAGIVLFACHLMGLLFYLVVVGAVEAAPVWRAMRERRRPVHALRLAAFRVLPVLPVPLLLYALSPLGRQAAGLGWWTLEYKVVHLATGFLNYDPGLDAVTALAFAGLLAFCAARRRLRVSLAGGIALAALAALYLVSPFNFKGTSFLDVRFAATFAFAAFALVSPRLAPVPAMLAASAAALLFIARMSVIAGVWHAHAAELAQLRDVIAPVEPGDRVLFATVTENDARDASDHPLQAISDGTRIDLHLAALLTIERRAFWPFLFADPTQQPIRLRPDYLALADATRNIPNVRQLNGRELTDEDLAIFPLATHWECCYDSVLLLHAGADPDFSDPRLQLVRGNAYAALYRVRKDPHAVARLAVPADGTPSPALE